MITLVLVHVKYIVSTLHIAWWVHENCTRCILHVTWLVHDFYTICTLHVMRLVHIIYTICTIACYRCSMLLLIVTVGKNHYCIVLIHCDMFSDICSFCTDLILLVSAVLCNLSFFPINAVQGELGLKNSAVLLLFSSCSTAPAARIFSP